MSIIFNGRKLSPQHMTVLGPLLSGGYSEREMKTVAEKAFSDAGIPLPALRVGQVIYWSAPGGATDCGEILSIERRGAKIKAASKLRGRPVHLSESQVRVDADDL